MNAPLPGRRTPAVAVRPPRRLAFDPATEPTSSRFLVRPWTLETSPSGIKYLISHVLDAREHLGINLFVETSALSGTSAALEIAVQRALDRTTWKTIEGAVVLTGARTVRIERHLLGPCIRIHERLSGTGVSCLHRIEAEWLAFHRYAAQTSVAWVAPPLTSSTLESFTVTGVVPGLTLTWIAEYRNAAAQLVGTDSGSGTTDVDGVYTGSSTVPAAAAGGTATVIVTIAGDRPSHQASVT